jgi:hypothetical protein
VSEPTIAGKLYRAAKRCDLRFGQGSRFWALEISTMSMRSRMS